MIWLSTALAADVVVRAELLWTGSGAPIVNGAVWSRDGRIAAVGADADVATPAGAVELRAKVAGPGFVDGLTTAGLTGPLNKPVDQDQATPVELVVAELRAVDALDVRSPLVSWLLDHGVTTVQAGPSPGAPVGARAVVAVTTPEVEPVVVSEAALVLTLGEAPKDRPGAQSRMGSAAAIRQAFATAKEYRARRALPLQDRAPVDLASESLLAALDKTCKTIVVAHRAADLLTAIRIGEEFGLDLVLGGATEAWKVREELAEAGVPVLVGPVMARQWSELGEARDGTFANAALLADAGVSIGFMTGHEAYVPKVRVVGWEAAVAGTNGLGAERAMAAATLGTAKILGVEARKGSLAVGKDADVVLYDGDPFEYRTHVCGVVVAGAVVREGCR